jgi:hypothetical protein
VVSTGTPNLRAEAAEVYELAFDEARRALAGQESALGAFRSRAGVIVSAAAIVTSFLGGQALEAGGFTVLAWASIGAFAALGLAGLGVLWPDGGWEFDAIPNQIITSYIERPQEPADPIWVVHRGSVAAHGEQLRRQRTTAAHSSNRLQGCGVRTRRRGGALDGCPCDGGLEWEVR